MLDCVRRRFWSKGCTRGAPRPNPRAFASILLVFGILAWTAMASLPAQEKPPAGDPARGSPPRPAVPAPTPPSAPELAPPAAQPSPPRPVPADAFPPQQIPPPLQAPGARRFQFTIAPNLPLKDLLPVPPAVKKVHGPVLVPNLAAVPEVDFQAPLAKNLSSDEALKQTAHMIAKVHHLNGKKTDGFLEALRGERPDLAGLPLVLGDACRIQGDRSRELTRAVATVRSALRARTFTATGSFPVSQLPRVVQETGPAPVDAVPPVPPTQSGIALPTPSAPFVRVVSEERTAAESFWEQYAVACAQEDRQVSPADRAQQEHVLLARVAALTQVLAPEAPALRLGLVKYLAATSHVEATRALARLAIFSEEDEVRLAAVAALKVRRERDYTDILLGGLRYPWPPVAQRGADALVKLERTDLVPQLVDVLDQPDPRAPVVKAADGRRVHQVSELVRINHHRNCLLCHAPAAAGGVSGDTLTAAVPVPSDPLPAPSEGYRTASPDVLVRIDVTYLRQDFSALQAVADAHPWPEMQRFDFLVRTRELTEQEAAAYREKLATGEAGRFSPYHRAALAALRELTGRDTAPTAEAWRRLLNLPAAARPAPDR